MENRPAVLPAWPLFFSRGNQQLIHTALTPPPKVIDRPHHSETRLNTPPLTLYQGLVLTENIGCSDDTV